LAALAKASARAEVIPAEMNHDLQIFMLRVRVKSLAAASRLAGLTSLNARKRQERRRKALGKVTTISLALSTLRDGARDSVSLNCFTEEESARRKLIEANDNERGESIFSPPQDSCTLF
jgi:hypothetical protein